MNNTNYNKRQFWQYKRLYGTNKTITNQNQNQNSNHAKTKRPVFHLINNKIATDPELINRLSTLYIPPAYKDIVIAKSANNKIQAIGTDTRGRRQYIYNANYTKKRNDRKYDDILELGKKISKIEKDNETALHNLIRKPYHQWSLPVDYIPIIIYMLRTYHFRIGNERYIDENNSYGITTLKTDHIKFLDKSKNKFTIQFVGKKGIVNTYTDDNPLIFKLLQMLITAANKEDGYLFKYANANANANAFITPEEIQKHFYDTYNAYITPKMFRTWYGNYHFLLYLKKLLSEGIIKPRLTRHAKMQIVKDCSEYVSSKLNNTPTVSKKSYIDNKILEIIMRNPYTLANKIPELPENQHAFLYSIITKLRH